MLAWLSTIVEEPRVVEICDEASQEACVLGMKSLASDHTTTCENGAVACGGGAVAPVPGDAEVCTVIMMIQ